MKKEHTVQLLIIFWPLTSTLTRHFINLASNHKSDDLYRYFVQPGPSLRQPGAKHHQTDDLYRKNHFVQPAASLRQPGAPLRQPGVLLHQPGDTVNHKGSIH